jgi:hypothetical protein
MYGDEANLVFIKTADIAILSRCFGYTPETTLIPYRQSL